MYIGIFGLILWFIYQYGVEKRIKRLEDKVEKLEDDVYNFEHPETSEIMRKVRYSKKDYQEMDGMAQETVDALNRSQKNRVQ